MKLVDGQVLLSWVVFSFVVVGIGRVMLGAALPALALLVSLPPPTLPLIGAVGGAVVGAVASARRRTLGWRR